MSKEEIVGLKEEIFKEIRNVEQKLNLQIVIKTQEIEENNKKFKEKFNSMIEKHNNLITDITTQNIYFNKIKDLENFQKKMDSMIITHEIRINNTMKDIKDISYKFGKEISENLNVSGFIGPSCKYKTISNYLSSNINEVDRIKADIESNKRESKEIKKKMDEIIKNVLTLVDRSNSKCIEYTNNKRKSIEEIINGKIKEFSEKILGFKSLIMSQETSKDIYEKLENMILCNNYNKLEIDDMLNNAVKDFEINLTNFKNNYNEEISKLIKINVDKLDNDIKENNRSINEIKIKINSMDRLQNQFTKNNVSMRNIFNKNINNDKVETNNNRNNYNLLKNLNEDEKIFKINNLDFRNKTLGSFNYNKTEYVKHKDKDKDEFKIHNHNKTNTNNKDYLTKKIDKYYLKKNKYSEGNKNSINDNKDQLNDSNQKSDISYNKNNSIEKEINESPGKTNSINNSISKNNIFENKSRKKGDMLKNKTNNQNINRNENMKHLKMQKYNNTNTNTSSHKNFSNLLAFSMGGNQKIVFSNIETEINNEEINNDKSPLNNNKSLKKSSRQKRFSVRKLATVNLDEKINEMLPSMNINAFSYKNIRCQNRNKNPNLNSPVVKNVFHQNGQLKLKNYTIKQNLTLDAPVKITSSFGRTGYAFYDKKEEAIKNLINKGITKKMKEQNKNSIDYDFEFSPVSKITVYDNI